MSYNKYLQQKADIPLYLATAEAHQTGNLQAELSDRGINVAQKIKKSSADLINFYEGAEISSSRAKFVAASLLKMIAVSAFVKFIGDFAGGYGKGMNGYYNDQTDTVVIFADNIQNTDHLEKTFAHETAGHKGLQVLLGNEYTSIIDEIYSAVNQKHSADLQKLAATYGQDLNTVEGQRYIIEEYLANQADLKQLSGFKSFVQKIKLALRKVGFRAKWTDDEITTLMRRSLENVRKQRSPQT